MKHILTLAALVFATACFGQVPDWHVEDLLLYMDFDGNYSNLVPGGNQLNMQGVPLFASDSSRTFLELAGNGEHLFHPDPAFPEGEVFSLCIEFRLDEFGSGGGQDIAPLVSKWQSSGTENNEFFLLERDGFFDLALPGDAAANYSHNWPPGSWHSACIQVADTSALWIDGEFYWSAPTAFGQSNYLFRVGDWFSTLNSSYRTMDGALAKLVAWSSKLPSGAHQFFTQDADIAIGCIDPSACNYSEDNVWDDGSCFYECAFCQNGTVWNNDLGACVAMLLAENACLEGTVWNEELGGCVVANPSDTDFDGCVSMTDLLDLLSVFGTCNEVPWSCGDPLEYQDYDYETVQIGEQCWFAENLRAESYRNGDVIPVGLSDEEWSSTTSGAMAAYGEGSSACYSYSLDGDACDESWSLDEYGGLYNWYSVVDARGLCPSGWYVASDGEWTALTEHLGGSIVAGYQMKTTYGWSNGGNGSNSSGFSGLPGGFRDSSGYFSFAGNYGNMWSSSTSGSGAWYRYLYDYHDDIFRSNYDPRSGFSIRCIQDSE